MATTWLPKNNFNPRSFLLTNGDVIPEPELEETSTGLKVRLAGTTKSRYSRDQESLIRQGVDMVARQHKARYWMPVDLNERTLNIAAGFTVERPPARFEPTKPRVRSVAWWVFKHPNMPIRAAVIATWSNPNGYDAGNQIQTRVVIPQQAPQALQPMTHTISDAHFGGVRAGIPNEGGQATFAEFIRDNPVEWAEHLGSTTGMSEREAVSLLLKRVRALDALEEIEIPDLRGMANNEFDWLALELEDTNVGGQFVADMTEYLDSRPGIEKALELYKELVAHFRRIGIVLENGLTGNQLVRAMLEGDDKALTVKIGQSLDNSGVSRDRSHQVSVHLPTGTFVVTCGHLSAEKDKIAHAWEESRLLASLSGKEDVLLAYAEEYVRTEHARRTTKILGKRKSALAN